MKNLIVDSCVFLSGYQSSDFNNKKALKDLKLAQDKGYEVFVTEHIIDEVVNILLRGGSKIAIYDFISKLRMSDIKLFCPLDKTSFETIQLEVIDRVLGQGKRKAGFTDIYSMVVVELGFLDDAKILSYDHHFNSLPKKYRF